MLVYKNNVWYKYSKYFFFRARKKKYFFLFIAGSSCLMAFKLIISHLHASARLGNICAGNRCPPPAMPCVLHIFCPAECGCLIAMMPNCEIMGAKSRKFVKKNVTLKNRMDKKSSPMRVDKVDKRVLGPVLMGFFIMGFCDIVAPISGRIATEFPASQQAAVSFLPTMVFLWFLVLSTPWRH